MSGKTQSGGIEAKVSIYKVVIELDGQEVFLSAKAVLPNDTLEYRVTFQNTSEFEFSDVEALLPIPAGYTYIKGTAHPADAQITPKGLRWIITTFEPDSKVFFKARVRMKKSSPAK